MTSIAQRVRRRWAGGAAALLLLSGLLWSGTVVAQGACEDRDHDGFEDGASCATERDCQDLYQPIHPGAPEVCNGLDDDCSWSPDEGCGSICETAEAFAWGAAIVPDPVDYQRRPSIVRAPGGYGVSWQRRRAQPDGELNNCYDRIFVRLDDEGLILAGPVTVPGGPGLRRAVYDNADLLWTGREFWMGATDLQVPDCFQTRLNGQAYMRRIDVNGNLVGPPIKPNCVPGFATLYSMAWTGDRVVVIFDVSGGGADNGIYARAMAPDGSFLGDCTPWNLDSDWPTSSGVIAWNGQQIARVFAAVPEGEPSINGELYFARYDEDLRPIDPQPTRLTFSPNYTGLPSITWTGSFWAIAFEDRYPVGDIDIAVLFVDATGQVLDPPGQIRITRSDQAGHSFDDPDIVWNGQELAIFYRDPAPATNRGEIFMARVSVDGEHLLPDVLVTTDPDEDRAYFHDSAWGGAEYASAIHYFAPNSEYDRPNINFQLTGCRCTDSDGDQFTTCRGLDCDDSNAGINPLGVEVCGNGLDDDCDGLPDCMDVEDCPAAGVPPGDVSGLVLLADRRTLSWTAADGAERYDVIRGRVWELPWLGVSATECVEADTSATETVDTTTPQLGEALYYLVRAEAGNPASCLVGTWGNSRRDAERQGCP